MSKDLRDKAAEVAAFQGFSSLQERIRVFLTDLTREGNKSRYEPIPIQLSPKAIKRYNKMIKDIDSGKAKTRSFTHVDEMMKFLNS